MKKQLIISSIAILLVIMACKKTESALPENEVTETKMVNEVKQKMYDLSPEETTDYIRNLKNRILQNSSMSKSLQNTGSVAQDSALWEIEALLNYNFVRSNSTVESGNDTINYSLNINNPNTIDYSELTNAYSYIAAQINQHLLENITDRVKLIDISAFTNGAILAVRAKIIYTIDHSSMRISVSPCDPITASGHWSGGGASAWICTTIPRVQRGPNMCNTRLNCSAIACGSGATPYFTNVNTIYIGNNAGTNNPFYYYYPLDGTAPCNTQYLSASQLNANVALAISYAASNLPSGKQTLNYEFFNQPGFPYAPPNNTMAGYWKLAISYGVVNCGGTPD